MADLELFPFQQEAVDRLTNGAVTYYQQGPDRAGGRAVPYIGQLKAVTGAGKTPILASTVGRLRPAIVLWTTKFGSVVDQTVANLRPGGKYHHLLGLGPGPVEVLRFSDIPSAEAWNRIIEAKSGLTILVSTVAAWNSAERDDRLNVHRQNPDWGDKSRWDQLRLDRERLLWVVYDEAHNTTTEQIELLDDLAPAGFFVATASAIKGKLQLYLTNLPEGVRQTRIVPVRTRAVVDAQLLKSTLSIADFQSPMEQMIRDVVRKRATLARLLAEEGGAVRPRAIYVVERSNVTAKGGEARPVAIWRALRASGVPPEEIAVCTDTRDLPKDAHRVPSIDGLGPEYSHIIFNKRLQEGWDDPSVYVCYFDGPTESATRVQQVLGRALRQPGAGHFADDDLNTAYFYIQCPTSKLEGIIDGLKDELQVYRGDEDPDTFEPFKIKEEHRAPAKIPVRPKHATRLTVPRLQIELPSEERLPRLIAQNTFDFGEDDRAAPGKAIVSVVSMRDGSVSERTRDLLEDMRMRCGAYLQQQIRTRSKDCLHAIRPGVFSNEKLDKTACLHSKALTFYADLAEKVVKEYESNVQLTLFADDADGTYVVGLYQPAGTTQKTFERSGHPHYDTKAFNPDELEVAKALDRLPHVWVRNKSRLDYGIPLPVKSSGSSTFYPDFLWWVGGTVWALDPTGQFILEEKVRAKLLSVPDPLRIALLTRGKLDGQFRKYSDDGWSLLRRRMGNTQAETFDTVRELLAVLVAESAAGSAAPRASGARVRQKVAPRSAKPRAQPAKNKKKRE